MVTTRNWATTLLLILDIGFQDSRKKVFLNSASSKNDHTRRNSFAIAEFHQHPRWPAGMRVRFLLTGLWLAGYEGMKHKMETTMMDYMSHCLNS